MRNLYVQRRALRLEIKVNLVNYFYDTVPGKDEQQDGDAEIGSLQCKKMRKLSYIHKTTLFYDFVKSLIFFCEAFQNFKFLSFQTYRHVCPDIER